MMSGLLAPFTRERRVDLHRGCTIRTIYTNEIRNVDTWIQESKAYMQAYELVFVGIDLEYTLSQDKKQSSIFVMALVVSFTWYFSHQG